MSDPKREITKKRTFSFGFIFFGFILSLVLSNEYGFYCNLTDSFPQSYFVVKKHFYATEVSKKAIITTIVDFENPYIPQGKKLVKQIACDSGEMFETRGKEFYCNGQLIAIAQEKDSKNRDIVQFVYNGIVPNGKMFLTAEHPKSFDSRYFGFIEKSKVVEVVLWRF